MVLRQTLIFLSRQRELEGYLKENPFVQQACKRFVPAVTREEALEVAREFTREGFGVNLHYLAESNAGEEEARSVAEEYCGMLENLAAEGMAGGVAVQLSHLGLGLSKELTAANLLRVARKAAETGHRVRVEMEGADLLEKTLDVVRSTYRESPNIGVVVQSFLKRSSDDIDLLNREKIPVTLVKGAFREDPAGDFKDREGVILFFMRLVETLMRDGVRPAIGTHDEKLIEFAIDIAFIFGLGEADYEFHMLYGIRPDLQKKLLDQGYRVRITLPYGKNWYPYFMRRLAEKPSNLWKLFRE